MSAAPRVYISSADKPQFVAWLSRELSSKGIVVFSPDQVASAGMDRALLRDRLESELNAATVFLPILTPSYVESGLARREMINAVQREADLLVIPLLAEASRIPPELERWFPADFRPVDETKLTSRAMSLALRNLVQTILSHHKPNEVTVTEIEFPADLIANIRAGQSVLYAGAGLSAIAGLPVWKDFASGLVEAAGGRGLISEEDRTFFRTAIQDDKTDHVVDQIVGQVEPAFILEYIRGLAANIESVPASHRSLAELPFSAALTTNFDDLLERAFSAKVSAPLTPADTEQLFEATTQKEFFLLKLYGTLDRSESLLVSPAQFQEFVAENQPFRSFIESLFVSRTILFVGCSLEGIETYLRGLRVKDFQGVRHYALAGVLGTSWETSAKVLERRFGIHVIPYRHGSDVDLIEALSQLRRQVGVVPIPAPTPVVSSPLRRILLDRIGPFENLDVSLQPGVNIFLGNNGVGKSTILRAIAAALCGRAAKDNVGRLIRVGSNHSSILLETAARNSYPFILLRTRGDVEVSAPASPIEAEGWLALGFPALRTISSDRPSGSSSEAASTPRVEDVLPLVKGDADFRLDQLHQWIVRLFNSANAAQVNGGDGAVYRRLLDKFFDVVGNLTEGVRIKLGTVDPKSERVTVITDDGEVPLALVSQGTASLIGWIGVVLQRLYEVYGGDEDPTQRFVLVLMDEIDAHMHPEWQRKLIPKLQGIFPNMQLVATTHSPLIVSGLKSENVFLVERRDGKVGVRQFDMKLEGQGTDDILTGPLFKLSDTRDVGTEAKLERYIALRSSDHLDTVDRIERNQLAHELFGRNGEDLSRQTSEVSRLVEKSLADQAEQRPPEEKKRILDEAERLIEATFAGISPERLR